MAVSNGCPLAEFPANGFEWNLEDGGDDLKAYFLQQDAGGSTGECPAVAQVMEKMIANSAGNIHDIDHLIRVWSYAKTIGELEGIDASTQYILEVAAITHDIACPLCREKYGNTNGNHQEEEGAPLARAFLSDCGMRTELVDRIAYLVGHHHTLHEIDGIDYQILIEADYIANASEKAYDRERVRNFANRIMKTESGKRLARSVFCL